MKALLHGLGIGLIALGGAAWGAPASNSVRMVSDVAAIRAGAYYSDHQSISIGPYASGALLDLTAFPWSPRVGVQAFMVVSNLLVFAPDTDFVQGANVYTRRDLVAFNPVNNTFIKYFNGVAAGIPERAGIDAVCLRTNGPGFLLSLDVSATLPGAGLVRPHDIVRWNGAAFSKKYTGVTNMHLPSGANVNALYASTNGGLYFSLDRPVQIGGAHGRERDVWRFTPPSGVPVLAVTNVMTPGVDLVGLDVPTDSDGDGLTNFEELSGFDEKSTVWPGTSVPLNPGGWTSNPYAVDTDGDGYSDAAEAVAGTNPSDEDDFLRMLRLSHVDGQSIVGWRSATGRTYQVSRVADIDGGIMASEWTVVGDYAGRPAQTTITNITFIHEQYYRVELLINP
ncbi:MAG TPA: thrombospondin type 3 repeat-containing protein [Kiritimatiellia bacterium]|nr:thrombospondin type 3 repeat-containing protein [Kiritimatiellia bacterium]